MENQMEIEEHIEKILRFYEYIKQGGRLSQDFHREREEGRGRRETELRVRQELRVQSWDLWHLQMQHCSARKRKREGRRRRERLCRGSSKSDERLPPASVNIK